MTDPQQLDALIVGGGIAGLWALNRLTRAGHRAVLFEADALGSAQTLASQGMIHGGLKYALRGQLTGASEAIAQMPERWRRCLAGTGEVDLTGLTPLAEHYYLFAAASTLGRLTGFFASRSLRGRIERLEPDAQPAVFREPAPDCAPFDGVVYRLHDFVLHTPALLQRLQANAPGLAYRCAVSAEALALREGRVTFTHGALRLTARRLLLCAGAGNAALLRGLGLREPVMQRRPLHQVIVRHRHPRPLFAHCLTGIRRPEPRLTITSHRDGDGWCWYLGGQIATDGVARTDAEQHACARRELEACVPWIAWEDARFESLRIDRAEPAQDGGRRPDSAFVHRAGAVLTAWPTKLSLAPDLGDQLLAAMPAPQGLPAPAPLPLPAAAVGASPW